MAKKNEYFDSIMRGLKEVKAHREGKIRLPTTRLVVKSVPTYTAKKVKALRKELTNTPSGAASRLFQIIEKDPALVTRAGILIVS
jgi:DNA-binding transcriptional regulator YiaG